ncbi:MAG: hypothetical protein NTV87_10840 [Ignavibacteriae bacterium]|jgi:hypothetical protein|nr:hypothetical protein [Ignavibacteriota bacterium]
MPTKIKILLSSILVVFAVSAFAAKAFAQEEFSAGSLYSAFGVGDLRYSASLRSDGMGIQGISLLGNYVNNFNNAANSDLENTTLSLGFRFVQLNTKNSISSSNFINANVTGVNLGIPVWRDYGMVINLGFNPYSVVNYRISSSVTNGGTTYKEMFGGKGGLSRLNFGASGRPLRWLYLGAEYNFTFGNIRDITYFDFNNQSIQNTYIKTENNLTGNYFKGGFIANLGELFPRSQALMNFNIGFVYQMPVRLSSSVARIYGTSIGFDTVNVPGVTTEVPMALGFGITKQFGKQFIVSTDLLYQKWGSFVPGLLLPGTYTDNVHYGIGAEILPAIKLDKTFWESISYRFGFTYDNSLFSIDAGQINSYAVNFGFGIPINKENSVDLAFQLGTRGKTDGNLMKDQYVKMSIGLNFGELWFIRSREEDK